MDRNCREISPGRLTGDLFWFIFSLRIPLPAAGWHRFLIDEKKIPTMENYMTTLSEVMTELRKRGYTEDFNLRRDCIDCQGGVFVLYPGDFTIDRVYRFEGPSDPADQAILYAISSEKHNLKGVLVNAYGAESDPLTDAMVRKLSTR